MTNSGPINTRLAYRCTAAVWLTVPGMSNSWSLKVFPHDAQFKRSRNLPCIRQDRRSCQELSQKNNLRTITRVGFDNSTAWLVALRSWNLICTGISNSQSLSEGQTL